MARLKKPAQPPQVGTSTPAGGGDGEGGANLPTGGDKYDWAQGSLTKFWLGESAARAFQAIIGDITPKVSNSAVIVATGFPWANLNDVYQFAMSVASGLITFFGYNSTRTIDVTIDHTNKVVKLSLGYRLGGFKAALSGASQGVGTDLISMPVVEPLKGGQWPDFCRHPNRPANITVRGQQITGNTVATDTLDTNPEMNIVIGNNVNSRNGMYGQNDMLLQDVNFNDPCEKSPKPFEETLINTMLNKLFNINA